MASEILFLVIFGVFFIYLLAYSIFCSQNEQRVHPTRKNKNKK
jgi:hypothetical protein